jgi:hypothetical protein
VYALYSISGAIPVKVAPNASFRAVSLSREPKRVPMATDIVAGSAIATTFVQSITEPLYVTIMSQACKLLSNAIYYHIIVLFFVFTTAITTKLCTNTK